MTKNSSLTNAKSKFSSKDLEAIIRYIKKEYELDLTKSKKQVKIFIYSPTELSSQEIEFIQAYLKKEYKIEAPAQVVIDKSILGGVRISYKDLEIDLSLNGRLSRLLENMQL